MVAERLRVPSGEGAPKLRSRVHWKPTVSLRFSANPQNAATASAELAVVRAPGARTREAPVILPKAIRARVNQIAHRSAQRHEEFTRKATLQTLEGMVRAGADRDELWSALTEIEQVIPPILTPQNEGQINE